MTDRPPQRVQLFRFALEGERVRKASAVLERESPRLAAAIRRAVPFLSRRGVPVALAYAKAMPIAELLGGVQRPFHATHLVTTPGSAHGALLLDAVAIAMFLDGVLGGDGQSLPVLNPAGLSGPQAALVAGLSSGIVRAISEALSPAIGVRLECRPAGIDEATAESAPIACALEFGEGDTIGRAILLLPKEVLLAAVDQSDPPPGSGPDPRIVSVLENVELDLVVDLGRVGMRLGAVAALKVGDTVRLDVPVNGTVVVRAEDQELLRGRPTTSGGRIAVKISGHEG
jgi:flagellar motor switch protein FliM